MPVTPHKPLPETHPARTHSVKAAMESIYHWNYEPEIDELRTLYANGLERQWIAVRDLDWEGGIDRDAFSQTISLGGIAIGETAFWKALPSEIRSEVSRRSTAFMLSNFLHGEQGALMVAAQLVNAVPDMDGKFYAATQTLDEARHVEAFAAYVNLLDHVYEISPGLKRLLDNVLTAEDWKMKAVGMQIVIEGLALYSFRDMRNQTREPLLKQLLTFVARDEARHTGYGIKYLSRVVPRLGEREKAELEDFAFECARLLVDQRTGSSMRDSVLSIWAEAGVDLAEAIGSLRKEREQLTAAPGAPGPRFGPIRGFVIPTLRSIGLFSDRVSARFEEMWTANMGAEAARRMSTTEGVLPEDLEAWVEEVEPRN